MKNNSIIKAQDEEDLIGTINHINEFVKMRLDGVEQAGKELLQMVFRVPLQYIPIYARVLMYSFYPGARLDLNQ